MLKDNKTIQLTSNFIGNPQSYPAIAKSPPIRPPSDLDDFENLIAKFQQGKCKTKRQ